MNLDEVRRHIQQQAYSIENFIVYDPSKKKYCNPPQTINKNTLNKDNSEHEYNYVRQKKQLIVEEQVDFEKNSKTSYDLNVEKDLYGMDNSDNEDIKDQLKSPEELISVIKERVLSDKEQYLLDIEKARNSRKRLKMTTVISN
jgi:hypothetical protein